MLGAWSTGIPQVCHAVEAVVLDQHLSLHYQNLLKCWWWRRVGSIVVLICGMVASVSHLMIGKRFETAIDIEIRDSRLYASRYTND
jgi:hypothetical protein